MTEGKTMIARGPADKARRHTYQPVVIDVVEGPKGPRAARVRLILDRVRHHRKIGERVPFT
jgi:hypothetical protein